MILPALPGRLAEHAVFPGDDAYPLLRSTYTRVAAPAVVLLPRDEQDVAAAIRYAAESGAVVSIRSGGHGLSGRSSNNGGIVIDLSSFDHIDVLDSDAGLVRVQAGARWGSVADRLARDGLAVSSGDHGNVGVGGLATAGGVGWMTRAYGLTIDRIRAITAVLVDGSIVEADADREPDLFWALRGAGGAVAIATEFELEAEHVEDVGIAQLLFEIDSAGAGLQRWSAKLAEAPRELTTNGIVAAQAGRFLLQLTAVVASADPSRTEALVNLLADGEQVLSAEAAIAPYTSLVNSGQLHPNLGQQPSNTTNALFGRLGPREAGAIMQTVAHPAGALVQVRSLGGAVADIASDETAWAHRDAEVLVVASTFPPDRGRALDAAAAPMLDAGVGSYRNFESRPRPSTFDRAFPGEVGRRVRELRARFDPDAVLRRDEREQSDESDGDD